MILNYSVLSPGEHVVLVRVHNMPGECVDLLEPVRVVKFHGDMVTSVVPDTSWFRHNVVTSDGTTRIYDIHLKWVPEKQDFEIQAIIPKE
jgi:hypothetical protein